MVLYNTARRHPSTRFYFIIQHHIKFEVQFRQFRKNGFTTQELIKKAMFLPEHIYVRREENLITRGFANKMAVKSPL